MKIFFYVDSFGYGHITRQIALARALMRRCSAIQIKFFLSDHYELVKKSLPNVGIEKINNHIQFVVDENGINYELTKLRNENLNEIIMANVNSETLRLQKESPDIIISDIRPEPFLAGQLLGIPVVAISNFSWSLILKSIMGNKSDIVSLYNSAYREAAITFVLPLNEPMSNFPRKNKVGLLRRRIVKKLKKQRKILLALGKSRIFKLRIDKAKLKIPLIKIPKNYIETQDLVNSSSYILAKMSYGIVSECIQSGNPFFFIRKENFLESDYILKHLQKFYLKEESIGLEDWLNDIINDIDYNFFKSLQLKYQENSDEAIASYLLDNFI